MNTGYLYAHNINDLEYKKCLYCRMKINGHQCCLSIFINGYQCLWFLWCVMLILNTYIRNAYQCLSCLPMLMSAYECLPTLTSAYQCAYQCVLVFLNAYQCLSILIGTYQCLSMFINAYQCLLISLLRLINAYQCVSSLSVPIN